MRKAKSDRQGSNGTIDDVSLSLEDVGSFVRSLASNRKAERDATLGALQRYLRVRETRLGKKSNSRVSTKKGDAEISDKHCCFDSLELMKLWKGLFYSMWMADSTPVQMELAENLVALQKVFSVEENAMMMLTTFFRTMLREWGGIDKWRMNKYYSLVRKMIRASLTYFVLEKKLIEEWVAIVTDEVTLKRPNGLRLHFFDVFLDEVVSSGCSDALSSEDLHEIFSPIYVAIGFSEDTSVIRHALKRVFVPLIGDKCLQKLDLEAVAKSLFSIAADSQKLDDNQRELIYETFGAIKEYLGESKSELQEKTKSKKKKTTKRNLNGDFDSLITPEAFDSVETTLPEAPAKRIRFSLETTQILDHRVSMKRLRTTPVKPAASRKAPDSGALKTKVEEILIPSPDASNTSKKKMKKKKKRTLDEIDEKLDEAQRNMHLNSSQKKKKRKVKRQSF